MRSWLALFWKYTSLAIVVISILLFSFLIGNELLSAITTTNREEVLFRKEIIIAIIQGASLLYLVFTLGKTWEMASSTKDAANASQKALEETRDMRDEESSPYVLVYFDKPYGEIFLYLVIENIGKTAAFDVSLIFAPAIQSTQPYFSNFSPVINGIPSLAPGQEVKTLFDVYTSYTAAQLPLTYTVNVIYFGGRPRKEREEIQVVDISMYEGTMYPSKKDVNDIAKEVEKMQKSVQSIAHSLEQAFHLQEYQTTALASPTVLITQPTQPIQIVAVLADPIEVDLDGEYVLIRNTGATEVVMTAWTLQDEANTMYTFPVFTLAAGADVRVWVKGGVNDSANLYWGRGSSVWNNTGDVALLHDANGMEVARFSYSMRKPRA